MTNGMSKKFIHAEVFLKGDLSSERRALFYDDKTFEVFCLSRRTQKKPFGKTTVTVYRRQYLRASIYKEHVKRTGDRGRRGGRFRRLRWWPSKKKDATKWNPKTGEYSRVHDPYTGKTTKH